MEDLEVYFSLCMSAVCLSVRGCVSVCLVFLSVYVSVCVKYFNGENFTMARYNCTSNGPRLESYVEDFEV